MSRFKIRLYKLRTWLGLTVMITIGFLIGGISGGFGSMFVMYLIWIWVSKRDKGLMELEWLHYHGLAGEVRKECESALANARRFRLEGMILGIYGCGYEHHPVLCRTCQTPYLPDTIKYVDKCVALQDTFPHDPKAKPPTPNPFRWCWFTSHGYPLPPDGWDDTQPWLPESALAPNPSVMMAAEGRIYYDENPNPLWDNGFGNPPEWYKVKLVDAA